LHDSDSVDILHLQVDNDSRKTTKETKKMTIKNLTVKNIETNTDFAEIVDVSGSCNSYVKGVNGFQVDMDIEYLLDNVVHKFHIILQTEEKNDDLRAYTGVEMYFAKCYGCDYDESEDFWELLEDKEMHDEKEEIEEYLIHKAEYLCEKYLLNNSDGE
jgi:hypothetical protein